MNYISKLKNDKLYRMQVSFIFSILVTFFFAIYNIFIGFYYNVPWNIAISGYYFFLLLLRILITINERKKNVISKKQTLFFSFLFFLLNISLIVPIILLVLFKRTVNYGTITSITLATYTTYKISSSIVYAVKRKKELNNSYINLLMIVKIVDALVSILTLQNTLVTINNSDGISNIFILIVVSSIVIFIIINVISFRSCIRCFKQN